VSSVTKPVNTTNRTSAMSKPNKPGRPWWRPIVDGIDRRVTPHANNLVRTNLFADTVATMTRLEVRLRRRMERQSTWLLHQYNLPTAGDIRKMRAQIAAVEAQLRDVAERLEDHHLASSLEGSTNARPRAASTPAKTSTPGRTKPKTTSK